MLSFTRQFTKDIDAFKGHQKSITEQYGALRQLKIILPSDHVICHMHFAENYVCSQADEVQSAYFDKAAVTLHPMVVY